MKDPYLGQFAARFFSSREIELSSQHVLTKWVRRPGEIPSRRLDSTGLSLQTFVRNHSKMIRTAMKAIAGEGYRPIPAQRAVIFLDKPRPYLRLSWIDRWIVGHLARLYAEASARHLSESVFSYIPGRGPHQAVRILSDRLGELREAYVFRTDIKSYADTMRHDAVLEDFERITAGGPILTNLMKAFVAFPVQDEQGIHPLDAGVLMGSHLMLIAGNIYFSEVDSTLDKVSGGVYARYGDDLIFAHSDESEVIRSWTVAQAVAQKRGIELHDTKTILLKLTRPSRLRKTPECKVLHKSSITYLGREIFWTGSVAAPREKQRVVTEFLRRAVAHVAFKHKTISSELHRVSCICKDLGSGLQQLKHAENGQVVHYLNLMTDDAQLRAIDRWLCEEIIRAAARRSFKKGLFRFYPPRKLRSLGLPSLVHLRRIRALS